MSALRRDVITDEDVDMVFQGRWHAVADASSEEDKQRLETWRPTELFPEFAESLFFEA